MMMKTAQSPTLTRLTVGHFDREGSAMSMTLG
jgi:hypothetical protein